MAKRWDKFMTEADKYVQQHVYALEAQTVNELWDEYQRALANMSIQLEAVAAQYGTGETWSYSDANAQQRTQALVDAMMDEMRRLTGRTSDITIQRSIESYYASLYGRAWISDTIAKGNIDIPVIPTEAVRAQILAPYKGSTFVERFKGSDDVFQQKIRTSLVQSQILGETMRQAQKRIAAELGLDISRRTKVDRAAHKNDFNRTQMIARTELIRSSNSGALAVYEANNDILKGWTWDAANDDRTCPECSDLDGQNFAFGDNKTPPPAHVNCRCAAIPWFAKDTYNKTIASSAPSFKEWAIMNGIEQSRYGGAYDLRGQTPPKASKQ